MRLYARMCFKWHFYHADVCIVSPPKAGRTWLRLLLAHIFHYTHKTPVMLDVHKITSGRNDLPNMFFTHDTSAFHKSTRKEDIDFKKYDNKKIVLLVRDPRDLIVSYYHQVADREKKYTGTISDFIRDERLGIRRLIEFLNAWCSYVTNRNNVRVVMYERMQSDAQGEIRHLLDFVGLDNVPNNIIERAVKATQFNQMKRLESKNTLGDTRLSVRGGTGEAYQKVRRGKIGGYRDELSEEDCKFVDHTLTKLRCDLFTYTFGD